MKTPMKWVRHFQNKNPPAETEKQVAEIFAECQRDTLEAAARVAAEWGVHPQPEIAAAIRALAPKARR